MSAGVTTIRPGGALLRLEKAARLIVHVIPRGVAASRLRSGGERVTAVLGILLVVFVGRLAPPAVVAAAN